ncbi:MAG: SRPBCC family protein [Solirubrobacteraceae bacterium]
MPESATRRRNGAAPEHGSGPPTRQPATKTASKQRAASRGATKAATKPKTAAKPKTAPPSKSVNKSKAAAKPKAAAKQITERVPGGMKRKLAMAAIKKITKPLLRHTLEAGAAAIRAAADRAAATGHEVTEKAAHQRLPIQRSVDVAVPLRVAWEEWSALTSIPEGVHTITDIERDGDELTGRTSSPRSIDWSAEILDERPEQSFAWQSHEGSDCAGLITFHELSRRLTRIELNLDVVPTAPVETAQLALKLADRRAESELRRFKARLELINPDLYEKPEDAA